MLRAAIIYLGSRLLETSSDRPVPPFNSIGGAVRQRRIKVLRCPRSPALAQAEPDARLIEFGRAVLRSLLDQAEPIWSCSRWGLPCLFGHPKSGELLPHRFTLARLRLKMAGAPLFPSLPHRRRSVLCGTFRPLTGYLPRAWVLPSTLLCGARTFLTLLSKGRRDHLSHFDTQHYDNRLIVPLARSVQPFTSYAQGHAGLFSRLDGVCWPAFVPGPGGTASSSGGVSSRSAAARQS